MDKQRFLTMLACGLCSKARKGLPSLYMAAGLRKNVGEPVAYLYNGVRLPKLPEWDRESYPYAVISKGLGSFYRLLAFKEQYAFNDDTKYFIAPIGTTCLTAACSGGEAWGEWEEEEATEDGIFASVIPKWSNFDILNEDRTVCLAASEPVPVYE